MMDDSHCDINIDGVESKGHFVPAGLMPPEEFALLALANAMELEPEYIFQSGCCGM